MTNEIVNFKFDGNDVRTMQINGEPWFVGNDIAIILGYSNYRNAVINHVDDEDKLRTQIEYAGQKREVTIINESGLYSLILSSKLSTAKKFKRWVTSEVLPSIRKHGAYATPETIESILADPDSGIKLLQALKDERSKKEQALLEASKEREARAIAEQRVNKLAPKALFADSVAASKSTVLVGELAKILKGNGVNIGANRLFKWMRENGYLINRKGSDWNMPTQRAMDMGLFKIKETTINHSDGVTTISKTPKVTGRGQQYFITKFLKQFKDD